MTDELRWRHECGGREIGDGARTVGSTTLQAVDKVKELGGAKRREALTSLTEEQHLDIDIFLMHFPDAESHSGFEPLRRLERALVRHGR